MNLCLSRDRNYRSLRMLSMLLFDITLGRTKSTWLSTSTSLRIIDRSRGATLSRPSRTRPCRSYSNTYKPFCSRTAFTEGVCPHTPSFCTSRRISYQRSYSPFSERSCIWANFSFPWMKLWRWWTSSRYCCYCRRRSVGGCTIGIGEVCFWEGGCYFYAGRVRFSWTCRLVSPALIYEL